MKILINTCFGGFGLSLKAIKMYNERTGRPLDEYAMATRIDETLIKIVEELKHEANAEYTKLAIVEVPDDSYWCINEYDGSENVTYTLLPPVEEYSAKLLMEFDEEEVK